MVVERPGREAKKDPMPKSIGWHGTVVRLIEDLRRSLPPKYSLSQGHGRCLTVGTARICVVDCLAP